MLYCFQSRVNNTNSVQHQHKFHEFFFCLEPEVISTDIHDHATHFVEDKTIATKSCDLFFFPTNQSHLCRSQQPKGCPNIVLYLSDAPLSSLNSADNDALSILNSLADYCQPGKNKLPIDPAAAGSIKEIFFRMEDECIQRKPGWSCVLKEQLLKLLVSILRQWQGRDRLAPELEAQQTNDRIDDVLQFINAQYMNPLEVDDMLRISCMSRSHFHAVFKAEVGCTFKEYLNKTRINHAADMIVKSDLPLSQIALSCGFSSQSRFNHVFKSITGRTPKEERLFKY